MSTTDVWMIVLAAVAAVAAVTSVVFLIADAFRRRRERPVVDLHIELTRPDAWVTARIKEQGRDAFNLKVESVGDGTPRHLNLEGNFTIFHHHEDESLAALPPGRVLQLPISTEKGQSVIEGRVVYVTGPGRRIKADHVPFHFHRNTPVDATKE